MNNETQLNCFKTASDYAKYLDHDIEKKLTPLNILLSSMKAHLDQCETVVSLRQENVEESTQALSSLTDYNDHLNVLCSKIDTVEKAVDHIKSNLNNLEEEIAKAEQKLGLNNDNLVVNILNPILFRKVVDKKNTSTDMPRFDRNEYFIVEKYDEDETL